MSGLLETGLDTLARSGSLSDGTPCRTLAVGQVGRLAEQTGLGGRQLEIAALQRDIFPLRYLRNMQTLSAADQIRLLESAVGIVGLGGLGGLVTETLARMGVGRLHLVDGDVFEDHNLNRQLFSAIGNLGTPKAQAALERIRAINPSVHVTASATYLEPQNADALLGGCDLVVDCLDTISSRFTLQESAKRAGIPMVSAAVAGLSGHVTTIFPTDLGLETIYGPPNQLTATKGAETRLGNLAPIVNLIASLECAETLKILLARGQTLNNRLLVVDLADYTIEILHLS